MPTKFLTILSLALLWTTGAAAMETKEDTNPLTSEAYQARLHEILDIEYLKSPYYARIIYQQLWDRDNRDNPAYQSRLAATNSQPTEEEKRSATLSDFYEQSLTFGTKGANLDQVNEQIITDPLNTLIEVITDAHISSEALAAIDALPVSPGGAVELRRAWQAEEKRVNNLPGGTLGAQNLDINLNAF